nr:hypothetical protein [uncultured Sphaerochaeta sp.]
MENRTVDRKRVEQNWDKEITLKKKSKFDKGTFYSEDYMYYCMNASKYTYEQALEEMHKYNFFFVVKSFVRHRFGTVDHEPASAWFCGDNEYGYHSVPVWMLTDDEEYYAPDGWKKKGENDE